MTYKKSATYYLPKVTPTNCYYYFEGENKRMFECRFCKQKSSHPKKCVSPICKSMIGWGR